MDRTSGRMRRDAEEQRDLLAPPERVEIELHGLDLEAGDCGEQPQCRICLETTGGDLIAPCRCRGSAKYVHRGCLDTWRSTKEGFAFSHCTTCRSPFQLRVHVPPDKHWRTLRFRFFVTRDVLFVTVIVQLIIILLGYGVFEIDSLQDQKLRKFGRFEHVTSFYYFCGVLLFLILTGLLGCFWTCYDRRIRNNFSEPCREACLCCCHPWICGDCYLCLWLDCSPCCETGSVAVTVTDCFSLVGSGTGEAGATLLVVGFVAVLVLLGVLAVAGLLYSLVVAAWLGQRIWQRNSHRRVKRMLTKEYVVEDLDGEILSADWKPPPIPEESLQQLKDLGLL